MVDVDTRSPVALPVRTGLRRGLAALLAVAALLPWFGLIDLGTIVGLADPAFRWEVPLEASWGCLFTFVVALGAGELATRRRPTTGIPLLAAAVAGLVTAGIATADPGPFTPAAGVAVAAGVLLALDPRLLPAGPRRFAGWPPLVVAVLGIALWLPYSLSAFASARRGANGDDVTNGISHWPVQGATGVTVLVVAAAIAVLGPWPLLRWSAALTGSVVGIAALAYPDRAGATEGPVWAAATIAWSALVLLLPRLSRPRV